MDDRRNGIKKRQRLLSCEPANGMGQARGGQRAGGDNHIVPVVGRQTGDFFPRNRHQRMRVQDLRNFLRKAVAVNSQRAACRHLMRIGTGHDQRVHAPHFVVDQPHGIGCGIIRAKRIGADKLRKSIGLMGVCAFYRAHFV